MIKKCALVLAFFLFAQYTTRANFVYDANCVDAYKAILSLRVAEGRSLIQKEKQQNPQNGIIILLENYVDYFSLLASENKADYERLKDSRSARISALEDNDKNSPFYLYAQAEVYLQWSFLKAKFGDYMSSAFDAKKASNLLKENEANYPDFLPNKMSLSLVNIIFGSIPANFKGITRFLGMSGDVRSGLKELESLRVDLPKTKYAFYNDEVIFFICNTNIDGLRNYAAYPKLITYLSGMENGSLLRSFLQGYIAIKTAHNDDAINFLEAAPRSPAYVALPAVDYYLGCAQLNKLDNETPASLSAYIRNFTGINYIKDAYLKLAYYYLLQNDAAKYEAYLKLVRTKGYAIDQKDKQALKEANDARPDINLLKARLYFDGGYYAKALDELRNKDVNQLKLLRDKTELYYRLGRIYDKTGKPDDAVENYQKAIDLGKTTSYYYAANAAVSCGRICEEKKDLKRAADFYNQALAMKNHEYQDDTDNDAKAGLKRMGE